MRGHIVKRYKDSYTVVLNLGIDPATGKRKQQWVSIKGTKKDAEKKLAELLHQLDTGTFMKPGKTTVKDFLERWLDDYARPNLAPRTVEGYEAIVRQHLIPKLGNISLTQLKSEHVQKYYAELLACGRLDGTGKLSPRTVRHHHMVLHKAIGCAVDWGILARNVVDAVTAPRELHHDMATWNEDETRHFLEIVKDSPYYPVFYLALFTGMRRSEILALRWSDIDLLLGQIYITRGMHHLRDGSIVFRQPKTSRSRRTIALTPSTIAMLKKHRENQSFIQALQGKRLLEDSLIFCDAKGRPLLPNTITHVWIKEVRKSGLKNIRFHDTRHSHASLMLKQGVHPKIVQERLGHSSIQITLDTYSHVAPGLQEAAAARFDEWMALKPEPKEIRDGEKVR